MLLWELIVLRKGDPSGVTDADAGRAGRRGGFGNT